jgi:hypothetical protein
MERFEHCGLRSETAQLNVSAAFDCLRREQLLALMFCTKKSEKTGIPDEIGCESTALWAKNLTHIGRTCKINQ